MEFIYLPGFVKKLKEYAKKHPSLKNDFEKSKERAVVHG
jgi:hypothetical protein